MLDLFSPLRMTRPRPLRLVAALGLGLTLALSPVGEAFARGAPESFADLAADVSPVDLANFRAAGINALLLKPFDPQHLVRESQALLLARPTPSD